MSALVLLLLAALGGEKDLRTVHGVTISCQTWGREWAFPGFAEELDRLAALGVNWVAIHPYARIGADGSVSTRRPVDPQAPPDWLAGPIEAAHARGMALLVKPHLAYWGSPFSWRGEIAFEDPALRERFWSTYSSWIADLAAATHRADGFVVGTELDAMLDGDADARWRALIASVRTRTPAHLTYAANWDRVGAVTFWDALDAIGVQAYFPLSEEPDPDDTALAAGWERAVAELRALSSRTGKPVVFTEFGYSATSEAAARPWSATISRGPERERAEALQVRCLRASLAVIEREGAWLRGGFLWKWFVGQPDDPTFLLDTPAVRATIQDAWQR